MKSLLFLAILLYDILGEGSRFHSFEEPGVKMFRRHNVHSVWRKNVLDRDNSRNEEEVLKKPHVTANLDRSHHDSHKIRREKRIRVSPGDTLMKQIDEDKLGSDIHVVKHMIRDPRDGNKQGRYDVRETDCNGPHERGPRGPQACKASRDNIRRSKFNLDLISGEDYFDSRSRRKWKRDGEAEGTMNVIKKEIKLMFSDWKHEQNKKFKVLHNTIVDIKMNDRNIGKALDYMSMKYEELLSIIKVLEAEKKENFNFIQKLEQRIDLLDKVSIFTRQRKLKRLQTNSIDGKKWNDENYDADSKEQEYNVDQRQYDSL